MKILKREESEKIKLALPLKTMLTYSRNGGVKENPDFT